MEVSEEAQSDTEDNVYQLIVNCQLRARGISFSEEEEESYA